MSSIKKNYFYNIVYQILNIVIPLITTPYVSRILGSDGVGSYSYAYSIAYYFVMFAMLGVNNYGNRTIASVSNDIQKRSKSFWGIYSFQLCVSVFIIFLYIAYVLFLGEDKTIGWIMLTFVLSAALDINWFYFGIEQFKITVIRNGIIRLSTIICIFLFVKTAEDVYIYSFVSVIGILVAQVILFLMVKKYVQPVKLSVNDITQHIKPNLVLFIPAISISLYKFTGKIMLGAMSTNSEVGYYESSDRIVQIPVALISALGGVMLPRITNMLANNQKEASLEYTKKSLIFTIFVSAPMSLGIMAVAKEFVPIFYGSGFDKCVDIFQILLPSCIFMAFANVVRTQYLIPHKKDNVYIISVVAGAVINLLINAILIPRLQSIGAAIGTLVAEITVCVIQCFCIRTEFRTLKYAIYSIPFILSSVIMYVLLRSLDFDFLGNTIALLIKIVIGVVVYVLFAGLTLIYAKKKGFLSKDVDETFSLSK